MSEENESHNDDDNDGEWTCPDCGETWDQSTLDETSGECPDCSY